MTKLLRPIAYPFTGGAVALVLATLAGLVPYLGVLGSIAAGAFAIPIVRASGRTNPEADSMPRLLPPPPGLPGELRSGAALFFIYLAPWFLLHSLALLSQDVAIPNWVYPLLIFPMFFQVVLLVFLPAAVALLAIEGSPLSALSRARVMRSARDVGMAYGGLAAMVLLGGGPVFFLANWLGDRGRWAVPWMLCCRVVLAPASASRGSRRRDTADVERAVISTRPGGSRTASVK